VGKKPDEIERDIVQKREQIGRRIEGLQHRIQEDAQAVKADARERSSVAVDQARDSLKMENVKQVMEEHTLSAMAGAVGVGVLLGVVSEGITSGGRSRSNNGGSDGYRSNGSSGGSSGGGGLSSMIASLVGPAASTAQNELQDLVREGFSTLKGQVKQAGHEDKRVENRDVGVE
jgi:ElaB/YqjD/DUF883 family membrane-anchored ribosome-binding protein